MGTPNRYVKGDWKANCDVCGRTFLASKLIHRWDKLRVCKDDFEPRHPQDFVRSKIDDQSVPWVRPEPDDVFIGD